MKNLIFADFGCVVFVYVHISALTFPNLPTDMLMAANHPLATYLLRWHHQDASRLYIPEEIRRYEDTSQAQSSDETRDFPNSSLDLTQMSIYSTSKVNVQLQN